MLDILRQEIDKLESQYNRKQIEFTEAVNDFKKWVETASAYDIATDNKRQMEISKLREELVKYSEDIDRLKWLLNKMVEENKK